MNVQTQLKWISDEITEIFLGQFFSDLATSSVLKNNFMASGDKRSREYIDFILNVILFPGFLIYI